MFEYTNAHTCVHAYMRTYVHAYACRAAVGSFGAANPTEGVAFGINGAIKLRWKQNDKVRFCMPPTGNFVHAVVLYPSMLISPIKLRCASLFSSGCHIALYRGILGAHATCVCRALVHTAGATIDEKCIISHRCRSVHHQ